MDFTSWLPIAIFIAIIVIAIAAIPAFKIKHAEYKRTGKHPKGHYMGLGIALGLPLGIPLGLAMDNIAIGPALGVAIGIAIGAGLEKKHAKELRPLTPKEKNLQQRLNLALAILVILGAMIFFAFAFFSKNINTVSNFEECLQAGNPAMESYPRQCRHGDRTYTEIITEADKLVGINCESSSDCRLPMEYAIQSNCPYQAACSENKCVVICPLWKHDVNPEVSKSYPVPCTENQDCDCSEWDQEGKYPCHCLDKQCAAIVAN